MAVFGMDSSCIGSPDVRHHCGSVCVDQSPGVSATLGTFHVIHNGDLIFIKAFTPQTGLDLRAIGVVVSAVPMESEGAVCLPVKWVWQGNKHLSDPDDHWPLRGDVVYEEHDLVVQRQILDLLPSGLGPTVP